METVTLDLINKNVMKLRDDVTYLKHILGEEYELWPT